MNKNIIKSSVLLGCAKDKPLYKYLKKEYVDQLFIKGEILIGTLDDFKNRELYGDHRGDEGEGTKSIYENINTTVKDKYHNALSSFAQQYVKIGPEAKDNEFIDCLVSQTYSSNNCYVYCMSKKFDKVFYEAFQTDVCIKIKSPYKFINALSIALRNDADFLKLSEVIYGERNQRFGEHNEYHPCIIKPEKYNYQKEVRGIWQPKNDGIKPLLVKLDLKHIKRFCEIYSSK